MDKIFGWTIDEWACVFAYDKRDHSQMSFKHALEVRLTWKKRRLGDSPKASVIVGVEQEMDWPSAVALFESPQARQVNDLQTFKGSGREDSPAVRIAAHEKSRTFTA